MINTSSIHSFTETLPARQKKAELILSLQMLKPDQVKPMLAKMAHRGYLGCLPFAKDEYDEIAIRLLPNQKLSDSPIAITSGYVTEGLTIASNLEHFIVGRIAQRNVITHRSKEIAESAEEFLAFSADFGDVSPVEAILSAISEIEQIDKSLRPGKTWEIADANDPLCQVLAAAWSLKRPALGEWAINAIHQFSKSDIVRRLYVSHHILSHTGEDIASEIFRLIEANDIFDSTYISRYPKPGIGAWEVEALVLGVKWLQSQESIAINLPESLWQAAQAFSRAPHEKNAKQQYDGMLHLSAAKELAASEPELAYDQIINAAGFFARATQKVLPEAVILAYDICAANQWLDLQALFSWTREELGI